MSMRMTSGIYPHSIFLLALCVQMNYCENETESVAAMTTTTTTTTRPINIFVINEEDHQLANRSVENALRTIRNKHSDWLGNNIIAVSINGSDPNDALTRICGEWDSAVRDGGPGVPDLVLDLTRSGFGAETVQSFTAAVGVPTITTQFGQTGDLRQWRDLDDDQKGYLVQIMPPADLVSSAIRELALDMNITNAAIIFDDNYVMDHKHKSLLMNVPTRHVVVRAKTDHSSMDKQLGQLRNLDIVNYFVLGDIEEMLNTASTKNYTGRKYGWYAFSLDDEAEVECDCKNVSVLLFKPIVTTENQQYLSELTAQNLLSKPYLSSAFYYDVTRLAVLAMRSAVADGTWPKEPHHIRCNEYDIGKTPKRNLNLLERLKSTSSDIGNFLPTFAGFKWGQANGEHSANFDMKISMVMINNGDTVINDLGKWNAGIDSPLQLNNANKSVIAEHTAITSFRIVTVEMAPFMMKDIVTGEWSGYCIDMINEIAKELKFEYEIYETADGKFGSMEPNGSWNGMIGELINKHADIALGTLSVMAEREDVVDFTVPYYDLVGISILMMKPNPPTSLFKFLTVLENEVWYCILASYFFTSVLMWIFDRWSPYSYQNNKEKFRDDEEKREFDLKECLWFCMTSLTPQGGGEAPKNLSGRLVAATWWLFGFIIIASYTANLAAFLTVSRLETPIESLDDLSKQYKIQYSPVKDSEAYTYFQRMAGIETRFYEIWKDMSLNDSLNEIERAKLAVWDYPVSDRYTKMFQSMNESGFPLTREDAVARVRQYSYNSSASQYAFIGDATVIRYLEMTTCDLKSVGEEFSRKPYALAVQQGSPLKDQLNDVILKLLNKRKLEILKNKWWNLNPKKRTCEKENAQSDGISIQNIGGVFIVIFVGMFLACCVLAIEYWWYRYRPRLETKADDRKAGRPPTAPQPMKPLKFNMKPPAPRTNFVTRKDFNTRY